MLNSHIRFDDDAENEYEQSDSEEDYDDKEKELLKKVRNRKAKHSDSEEEVYGLDSDEAQSDIALSDVEGQEEDDLPDARAWGKDKRKFYSTDYVDPDYGGYQGKDALLAEIEEEEAKNLQKQLAQQLDDDDFTLDTFNKDKKCEDKVGTEEIIKTDVSKLSKRQKLQLLQRESPEFFGLLEDFKVKMTIVRDYLHPVIKLHRSDKIKSCNAVSCVQTHYDLILNYCTNICMYLLLKASRVNVQNHPIVKRLYQYRQLFVHLEPVFEEIIKPQIEIITKEQETNTETKTENKKKTLKVLTDLTKKLKVQQIPEADDNQPPKKKSKTLPENESNENQFKTSDEEIEPEVPTENQYENDDGKRAITYQMAKNRGLTPYRKKELRNPRVKHRNKFRKAKIRRKGAIRDVRRETSRYGGEISGIKVSVTKSIKIKS